MKKESQSVWKGCLLYIYKHVFKGTTRLKNPKKYSDDIEETNNTYNIPVVRSVLNIYIEISLEYDKEITIMCFSFLTGIDYMTIYGWGNDKWNQTPDTLYIYKTLLKLREESLSDKLVSGKATPVGILGILNHHYGWSQPGVSREEVKERKRTPQEIMLEYNGKRPELPEMPDE
jgi:hypothetical protein